MAEYIIDGNVQLYITNEYGDIFINSNSIADIVNNINSLKKSRTWNCILSTQAGGTHEVQELSGSEALITYGYVYRIQNTLTIPMDVFSVAKGDGGKILLGDLEIEIEDNTHIKVSGISYGYLVRVFVR